VGWVFAEAAGYLHTEGPADADADRVFLVLNGPTTEIGVR